MDGNSSKLAYTIPELCQATGISRSTIYREIDAKRLTVTKIGTRTIVTAEAARAWLAAHATAAA